MKKSKFISKYDYIDFHTKQASFLFHSNAEIISSIQAKIKAIDSNADIYDQEDEFDENQEIDSLNYFRECLFENQDLDKNNPKIIEGNILDKLSKQHIISLHNHISKIFDFDEYKIFDMEDSAKKTKELLSENNEIIIFQPVFINGDLITKCDALIKENNNIKIIETKGTTTVKIHHFLDLFFQSQVLYNDDLSDYNFNFYLCIVDYVKANKTECPFFITPYINYTKTISFPKTFDDTHKKEAKQGLNYTLINKELKQYESFPISIDALINGDFSEIESKIESSQSPQTKIAGLKAIELLDNTVKNFDNDINTIRNRKFFMLQHDQTGYINEIFPSYNDNGDFKKPDYWLNIRKLYQCEGYELFKYSGNVVNQTGHFLEIYQKGQNIEEYFKPGYYSLFFENSKPIEIDHKKYSDLLSNLKNKKVYFDFETINIATRVIDNTFPFMQIITQCSIIKDHDDGTNIKDLTCNNIVIDPLNINLNEFKKIVDELYCGDEYSYVVYNKSFESTRLKEISNYLNDDEYAKKIAVIRDNLFDLADFFTVKKDGTPVFIKEFGGFYSIKKVLPFIEKHHNDLFAITGCKDYKTLNVSNGLECQNKTTVRFFNKMTEEEWQQLYKDISIYCENDVRAMIAVELLVKKLPNVI